MSHTPLPFRGKVSGWLARRGRQWPQAFGGLEEPASTQLRSHTGAAALRHGRVACLPHLLVKVLFLLLPLERGVMWAEVKVEVDFQGGVLALEWRKMTAQLAQRPLLGAGEPGRQALRPSARTQRVSLPTPGRGPSGPLTRPRQLPLAPACGAARWGPRSNSWRRAAPALTSRASSSFPPGSRLGQAGGGRD